MGKILNTIYKLVRQKSQIRGINLMTRNSM